MISDKFELSLRNWFEKAEKLEPIYNLYFGTLYNSRMYLEHRFLSQIHAIESYHRRVNGGKYQENDEYRSGLYKKFLQAIPNELDNDFRESLIEGKLKYANDYSLRKRLKEILESCSQNLPVSLRAKDNRDLFIKLVVNTRNYLTHFEEKSKAATGDELYKLTNNLKILLEICLLKELEFSSETINNLISKRYRTLNLTLFT